jgi:uncharacterized membrane protein YtjA (UPF0391 family)
VCAQIERSGSTSSFRSLTSVGRNKTPRLTFSFSAGGHPCPALETPEMPGNLIYYALVLIVIALVAALLGFGGVAGTAMSGAHLLLWVAVVIVIVGVVFALIRRA